MNYESAELHAVTGPAIRPGGLELTARALEFCSFPDSARLLDVGCGSGVLLLAGAALGADLSLGVDPSRQAARLSRDNARDNRLAARVRVVQGSTECLRRSFEVLVANLPWPVQLAKVPELDRLASRSLVLSGFRDVQEPELLACYQERGWRLMRRLSRDEWAIEVPPEGSFTWVAWRLER